jgi:hypothetical protein
MKRVTDFSDSTMSIPQDLFYRLPKNILRMVEVYGWDIHRSNGDIKFQISSSRLEEFEEAYSKLRKQIEGKNLNK